jgi:DUF4097 and DUF4098 domain-containing protein YvlB
MSEQQWTIDAPQTLTFEQAVDRLRVRTVAGAVNVVAAEGPARLEVTQIEGPPLQVTLKGGELTVTYDDLTWKDFHWKSLSHAINQWRTKRRAVVSLTVPAGTRIELGSASSETVISGITGAVTVHSASGAATLVGLSGTVEANTVSGNVHAQSVSGDLKVNTVSGELTVFEGTSGRLKANSVSGAMSVDLAHDNATDVNLNNVSGEVAVRLPAPTDAKVHANTTSGDISSSFDELRVGGTWGAKQITGTLGKGTGTLKITTISGAVALLRRPSQEDDAPADAPLALDFSKNEEDQA